MKKIYIVLLSLLALNFSSCNYLDVVPDDTATLEDAFKNEENAQKFIYSIYGHIGNMNRYWMPGQIFGGDDCITNSKGTTRWFGYKSMIYGEETANTTYHNFMRATGAPTGGVSYDYYTAIRYCYMLLNNINSIPDISEQNLREWQGEAWFMIGMFHWWMVEYYGPIVIVDREISLNASEEELYAPRSSFDECIDFICDCLDKAIEYLPARQQNIKWYGRATSAAAYAFKARVLLFAASPLFNGNAKFYADLKNHDGKALVNTKYDPEKWKRAMDAAEEAIQFCEQNGYALYKNAANGTLDTFERGVADFHDQLVEMRYNDVEFLWAFCHSDSQAEIQKRSGIRTTSTYSTNGWLTNFQVLFPAVESYYTKNGLPLEDDPLTKGRNLYVYNAVEGTAELNLNREPRFYACVTYDGGEFPMDGTVYKVQAKAGEIHGYTMNGNSPDMSKEYVNETGYFLRKFIHKDSAYDVSTKTFAFHNYAWPLIRMAELYLSYVEADFEYNGSLSIKSFEYLNKVRERCGLPTFQDSWAMAGGIPTGEKLRQVLHRERNNELMFEGHRYRDMRRWMDAEKHMLKEWKCWNVWGQTAEEYYTIKQWEDFDQHEGQRTLQVPRHYLLPYPLAEIQINPNLVQNPGY